MYQGYIKVYPNAQKTNAYQANRNLLLSKQARADSIPGLEIEANDVRCTHGATASQLQEEYVFYLMSRAAPAERRTVGGTGLPRGSAGPHSGRGCAGEA